MKVNKLETVVGIFVVVFAILFVIFTMKMTSRSMNKDYYRLNASFDNIEGVNVGTKVKIGGVEIGSVEKYFIDENYKPTLTLKIKKDIQLPIDSNLKISTSGIIGGKYLKVLVGGEEEYFVNGDTFEFTESTMDLEDLITRFMLNKVSNEKK